MPGAATQPRSGRLALVIGLVLAGLMLMELAGPTPSRAAFPKAENGRLVFERGTAAGRDLHIVNLDGSGVVNLTQTPDPISEFDPVISPDGEWVAYTRTQGPTQDIWLVRSDGSEQVVLTGTAPPIDEANPAFSPDGKMVAFDREVGGEPSDIVVMNLDGSGETNLTNTPAPLEETDPTWSPDGRRIFFQRCATTGMIECHVWGMNSDGTEQVNLTGSVPQAWEFVPAASPDGRALAFVRCAEFFGPCFGIFVKDLESGVESGFNPTPEGEFDPVFSPDTKRLAFNADTDPGPQSTSAIFTMNSDGSSPAPLTSPPAAGDDDTNADWEHVFRCGKKEATIVGDDGPDRIRGTKKRDVIVANAGKDVVRARGGNDRVCLGKGRDKAVGGKGNDKCVGGKGNDKGKGCEKGKL